MKHLHILHQPLDTFVFMGCWNKTGCAIESAEKAVLNHIRLHHPTDILVLGGDNVYPEKVDGEKQYSEEKLKAGFACVKKAHSGILLVALGNHNVATPLLKSSALKQGLPGEPYALVVFSNKKALLILDTNEALPLVWIAEALVYMQTRGIQYYIVQHEPLVGFKQKKVQVLKEADALLTVLTFYPPLLILAADVHNYQKLRIQFGGVDFIQVISGTGGATLDPLPSTSAFSETGAGFSGHVEILESQVAHGYQVISDEDSTFIIVRQRSKNHSPSKLYGTRRKSNRIRKNRNRSRRL